MILEFVAALIGYDLLKIVFSSMVKVWVKSKNPAAYDQAVADKRDAEAKWDKRYNEIMDSQ